MSFCGSGQQSSTANQTTNQNQWANALGASSIGPNGRPVFQASGAPQLGAQALGYLGSSMPAMNAAGQNYASALTSAASNPGWGAAQTNAANTAAGDYLAGSPELNRALAENQATASAGAADAAARTRSTMNQNGMAWGTGNQQAEQGAVAQGNEAAAATNANAYLNNYQAERGAQNAAGGQLAQAQGAPLSYLGSVGGAYTSGLSPAATLISGLGSGGQIYSGGQGQQGYDAGTVNPSTGQDIMNGISSAMSF
jgi:hypothetical protein